MRTLKLDGSILAALFLDAAARCRVPGAQEELQNVFHENVRDFASLFVQMCTNEHGANELGFGPVNVQRTHVNPTILRIDVNPENGQVSLTIL